MEVNGVGLCVVALCIGISGLLSFHNVFGETDSMMSLFQDLRNELNSLKLSNERNNLEIKRLDNQVSECHTKYADLSGQIKDFVHFEKRLTYIENEIEARNHEVFKRVESVQMSRNMDKEHENNNIITEVEGNSAVVRNEENVFSGEARLKANFGSDEDKPNLDIGDYDERNEQERRHQVDKRIVPVTRAPTINTKIAFSAFISQSVNGLKDRQLFPFDTVNTNEGLAFDTVSHIFTCPVSGIYFFACSLFVNRQLPFTAAHIVKDDMILTAIYFQPDTNAHHTLYDQSSNSVVTVCNKGERVWVRAMHNEVNVYNRYYTTFSGFLLSTL